MSHLIKMIREAPTFRERIGKAHMLLMLEAESTAEVLLWHDPESIEKLMDEIKALIKAMPEGFEEAEVKRDPESGIGYMVSSWYSQFFEGIDAFIVNVYRGGGSMTFINAARTLLHYAEIYLEENKKT